MLTSPVAYWPFDLLPGAPLIIITTGSQTTIFFFPLVACLALSFVRPHYHLQFQVDLVCHGETPVSPDVDGGDPYAEPRRQGKFRTVASGNALTTEKLVQRIVERRMDYESRNAKKEAKEKAAYEAYLKVGKEQAAA